MVKYIVKGENNMKTFIENFMCTVFNDFQKNVNKEALCDLKELNFKGGHLPDYTKEIIQQLYLLRYFPAYLTEYKYLYKKIIDDTHLESINVLSIGCGSFIDYYGLIFAIKSNRVSSFDIPVKYIGIDVINWKYKNNFNNQNVIFIYDSIENFKFNNQDDTDDTNVLIFPKSLSELSDDLLDNFVSNISNTKFSSKRIYLISSIMNIGYNTDEDKYKKIIKAFQDIGYSCKNYEQPKAIKNNEALFHFDSDFYYPDDVKEYLTTLSSKCIKSILNKEDCQTNCKELDRWPILKTDNMSFQVNLLECQ
jgi:hypothetical protein